MARRRAEVFFEVYEQLTEQQIESHDRRVLSHEHFAAMDGKQPNEPARGAEAIVRVVEAEDPPLRLPLGPEAFERVRDTLDEQRRELDTWEKPGAATAFIDEEPA